MIEEQVMSTVSVVIEPIPANPGYLAAICGHDEEVDPIGSGPTRMAAAFDLTERLLEDTHPALCLAIAALLEEYVRQFPIDGDDLHADKCWRAGIQDAIAQIKALA
jgi:hypothetical protein